TSLIASAAAHTSRLRSLSVSPDGAGLATAGEDRRARIWDLASLRMIAEVPEVDEANPEQVAFSPDGEVLAAARGPIQLYRLRDGAAAFLRPVAAGGDLLGIAWTESGLYGGDAAALSALRFRDGADLRTAPLRTAADVADRLARPAVLEAFLS